MNDSFLFSFLILDLHPRNTILKEFIGIYTLQNKRQVASVLFQMNQANRAIKEP